MPMAHKSLPQARLGQRGTIVRGHVKVSYPLVDGVAYRAFPFYRVDGPVLLLITVPGRAPVCSPRSMTT